MSGVFQEVCQMLLTQVKDVDGIRIITILDDVVEITNCDSVFSRVRSAISEISPFIVLDLTKVRFIDSFSIGMLVTLLLYARRIGGELVLTVCDPKISHLFEMMQLDRILKIFDNNKSAVLFFDQEESEDDTG